MALNDNAVITAAQGYVFIAPVGTAKPSPSVIDTVDPETFGSQVQEIKLTSGTASSGTYSVAGVADTPVDIDFDATAAELQVALEGLESIGAGNVLVTGTDLTAGYLVTFIGALQGVSLTALVLDDANLVGTSPILPAAATIDEATNGWKTIGHTSRDDMPEFAFDGGDTEVKGTWQKKRLREVATGDPVADSVTINLQQWDATSLELYFGANGSTTPGVFDVSGDFVPVEYAILVIIVDGAARIAFHSSKASIRRDDSVDLPVDEFASLPVKATFLNLGANPLYSWISLDLLS